MNSSVVAFGITIRKGKATSNANPVFSIAFANGRGLYWTFLGPEIQV